MFSVGSNCLFSALISHELRGGRYTVEFMIDQRRCDIFSLLTTVLAEFQESREATNFVVRDFRSTKEENVVNLQLEFEEVLKDDENRKLISISESFN